MGFSPALRIEAQFRRSIVRIVRNFLERGDRGTLDELAELVAQRMLGELERSNDRAWREMIDARSMQIYEGLQREMQNGIGTRRRELVAENARLITRVPERIRTSVNLEIARMGERGMRPDVVAQYLERRIPQLTRRHAAAIARTETSKAASALTRARSESLRIDWYEWLTAKDQRVRASHRLMEKVLVSWKEPPNPEGLDHVSSRLGHYHAGNAPNCRCVSVPLISLAQVAWPARVYWNNAIHRMTMAQFAELSGIQRRAA